MNYDGSYSHQRKFSASSAILLLVFVAAALVMVAIVVWKPLVHEPATSAGEAAPAQQPALPATAAPEAGE